MKNSAIEWCDHTFNPWEGCTKVSPGCAHCYAEARNARFGGGTAPNWGSGAPRRRTSLQNWNQVRRWNREEETKMVSHAEFAEGRRPRVFCASLADWLDDEVPLEWFMDLMMLASECRSLDFLLLSKRPQNWHDRIANAIVELKRYPISEDLDFGQAQTARWLEAWQAGKAPANVWVGTSVENQDCADKRIPELLKIPARVRFLSCEPLLGPVDLVLSENVALGLTSYHNVLSGNRSDYSDIFGGGEPETEEHKEPRIHWVICGGESGLGARSMHPAWASSLRDQCKDSGVAFLFKQWGEWQPSFGDIPGDTTETYYWGDMVTSRHVGKKAAGRLLDGIEHNGFPV